MKPEEVLATLQQYILELDSILSRFTRTRDAVSIDLEDDYRVRELVTEVIDLLRDHVPGSASHIGMIANYYNVGIKNFAQTSSYASVKEIRGAISAVAKRVQRNPALFDETSKTVVASLDQKHLLDALNQIVIRFHAVAVQLRSRHADRSTLDINDEYDVQDLMHALLRLYFDDVRPEEWVPSYGGSSSRTDFLLPQIDTVIETKRTRVGLNARAVGEQLIIDIAKYKRHPQCRRLVCFVYDPEGRIANPSGIESDLTANDQGIDVQVYILPKAAG
jgi:REase_DpnII-MboI